jgi:leucyl aminopeptidase
MKIDIRKGKPTGFPAEALVVTQFEDDCRVPEGARWLDDTVNGRIKEIIGRGDFKGKRNQIALLYMQDPMPVKRIVLAGLGQKEKFTLEILRGVYAKAAQHIRELGLDELSIFLDEGRFAASLRFAAEAALEGAMLGLYQFTPYKTLESERTEKIRRIRMIAETVGQVRELRTAAESADIIVRAVNFTRDLVSTPGNDMTPSDMEQAARKVARHKHIRLRVLDVEHMKSIGMHALLGVARGSDEPAKFIILEYGGAVRKQPPIVLVGKGLTFDSGGISIKSAENMVEMKSDMAGGAAVMGALMAAAELGLPLNVVALIPATENLPSGRACKPGDVLTSLSGKTIEVVNTDAEGRLILADALTYALRYKPAALIDLATLTGACKIALGDHVIGMLGNNTILKERFKKAADQTGERVWELPLWEDYDELIKSDVADFKNTGGKTGGAITAAAFLSKFTGDASWVHLDIAGPAWLAKDRPYSPKGASGIGVRLLVQCLRDWDTDAAAS